MSENQANDTADIDFLVSSLEEELNLLQDYENMPIDPQAKQYLQSFCQFAAEPLNKPQVVSFIDNGLKIMNYLGKHPVDENLLSQGTVETIVDMMIQPDLLLPVIKEIKDQNKDNEPVLKHLEEELTGKCDKAKLKLLMGELKNVNI